MQIVLSIIIRERGGNSVPAVFRFESAALGFVKARINKGTILHADASPSWDDLHAAPPSPAPHP